jgi:hypothetical protein
MRRLTALTAAILVALGLSNANAAFIVEADNVAPAGKANDHFSALPANGFSLSTASTAVGLAGNQSAFGNPANATGPDQYTFRYTPGTDADNTVYTLGDVLGNSQVVADADGASTTLAPTYLTAPQLATGLAGGATGIYNVYFTTPTSTNVNAAGSLFDITSDLPTISLNPVVLNDGATGPDSDLVAPGWQGGANNRWLKIATVPLTAGNTYTVTLTANQATFVSQRAHGVMWEFVGPIIPEPSTLVLSLMTACLGLPSCRRRIA